MAILKTLILCTFFYLLSFTTALCQHAYWQQQVNYNIDVSLNDVNHSLDGFVKMEYINNSPDTLRFIWLHVWPNAFKNDRTAFSDQLLENGRTDFYFSNADKRGYINRLNFSVNGNTATMQDHPQHQDIIKVILPRPLLPGHSCNIETPFHVKLPSNFSRGGHNGQDYQITQWHPKPAVYDTKGWHEMPYLDEGEFYSEFGNYKVQITLPENYVVAATGNLQQQSEREWLLKRKTFTRTPTAKKTGEKKTPLMSTTPSAGATKTLNYIQNSVHDFAWFASKDFTVKTDELLLPSGKKISVYAYYYSQNETIWRNSLQLIKQAIITKSKWVGEYPYDIISVVEDERGDGGMEYPTITFLSNGGTEKMLDFVINHEVGHNWFYGILASNERQHPWMDEGMNTFYDSRYMQQYYGSSFDITESKAAFIKKRMPHDIMQTMLGAVIATKKDQPVETPSAAFSSNNYSSIAYTKAGSWMALLEKQLGKALFDSCIKTYYSQWQFKHPYPEDFKKTAEQVSGKNLDSLFSLLQKKGALEKRAVKKSIKLTSFFSLKDTEKYNYVFAAPAAGYNFYDKIMIGALLHNYTMPATKLQFAAAPLYAVASKSFNGIGKIAYSWFPGSNGARAEFSFAAASFNRDTYKDSTGTVNYMRFSKLVPAFKYIFAEKNSRNTVTKYMQFKTFLINETELFFDRDPVTQIETIAYPVKSRYVNQLQFVIENERALYPYSGILMAEQGDGFVRTSFTGNYFFNYGEKGGLNLRIFAGKFFYTADKTFLNQFATERYHLNMTGPRGNEDYTYSNYFAGRNEFEGLATQQLMIRDGGFKIGTDLLFDKVGKTDNWLAAANLTTDIPDKYNPLSVLPVKIPLKLFLDVGSSASTWRNNGGSTGRFVYDAGVQVPLFKGAINIYVPLLYSKVYRDYFTSYITEKKIAKKIGFSINFSSSFLRKALPFSGF
jgi:hypothetical protein